MKRKKSTKKIHQVPPVNAPSNTDPNGSYTGVAADGGQPVQDADDL